MKKYPILYLIIGIAFLIIPTLLYLIWLVPRLSDAYNTLLASGGIIGGAGFYGASKIPEKLNNSSLYKLAANSFTVLTVITLVQQFISELIVLAIIFIVSFIIFKIFGVLYKNGREIKRNEKLSEAISQNISKSIR